MQRAGSLSRPSCGPLRRTASVSAPRRAVVAVPRATAAADDRPDAAAAADHILTREWAVSPTWSVGVSARPAGQRDSTRRNTVARSAASEEGVDAAGTLHGEWPLLSTSLASYDDVSGYYLKKKSNSRH